jgi:hypothetical protein
MKHRAMWRGQYNGAYYYSKEIREFIIPNIKTDRNWITINLPGFGADHSIVFVHNNLNPYRYDWLKKYHDLILVVGVPETAEKVAHLGKTIYLPLPIDKANVAQYIVEKDKEVCYAGRGKKFIGKKVEGDPICDVPREEMLKRMAHYKKCYAVGRTAIEAKILGCEILPYDERFPDPSIWKVFSYEDAVEYLQEKLDEIDSN